MRRDDDLDRPAALDGDPEVMRYIGDGTPLTREQVTDAATRLRAAWQERGFGLFAAEVRETGEFAGWVGLSIPAFLPEVMPTVERSGRRVQAMSITRERCPPSP